MVTDFQPAGIESDFATDNHRLAAMRADTVHMAASRVESCMLPSSSGPCT